MTNSRKKTMFLRAKKTEFRVKNTATVDFPNGAVVETTSGQFFYIQGDVKLKIIDPVILASWRFVNIPLFVDEALKHKITSGTLKLRNGTIVRYGNAVWYASDRELRRIDDARWYEWLNINNNDIIDISQKVFDLHKIGEPLS